TVEAGELAVVAAVGVADPDVILRRAAIALAIPGAGATDVGDRVAGRGEDALLALRHSDPPGGAALGPHRGQLLAGRKASAARGGKEDVLAVRRPAANDVVGRIAGQPAWLAALARDDKDVIAAVAVGAEGDGTAVRAEDGEEVMGLMHGDGPGDSANGLDHPDVAKVAEGDQFTVGADVGSAGEADGFLGLCGAGPGEESGARQ